MIEHYGKQGFTFRYEQGSVIRLAEAGEAFESSRLFRASSLEQGFDDREIDASAIMHVARTIQERASPERLLVMEGLASHQFQELEWEERFRRIHATFASNSYRITVHLDGYEIEEVCVMAQSLRRSSAARFLQSNLVLLEPAVTALLISGGFNGCRIEQRPGGIDGKGQLIRSSDPPWPNWFRPSYRSRPVRTGFNLAALPFGELKDCAEIPRAIAVVGSPQPELILLIELEGGSAIQQTRIEEILAVGLPARWYPYGAGCWGSRWLVRIS